MTWFLDDLINDMNKEQRIAPKLDKNYSIDIPLHGVDFMRQSYKTEIPTSRYNQSMGEYVPMVSNQMISNDKPS
tara:strand:+ start:572 stop:793 length:222 start_codon:yes stop_codon:yes gene_type:complete